MLGQLSLFTGTQTKVDIAIERLREFEPQEGYYVAISGGKDSDVIVKLVELAGVKYDLHHQHTTVDAPETVRYIKKYYTECDKDRPELNMWQLIRTKGMPPTRIVRFCCQSLKEYGGEGRTKVLGVRWQESVRRKNNRKLIETCYKTATFTVNPIIDWTEAEVWEFHKTYDLPHNPLYDEGFKRIGCIMCPQKGAKAMREDAKRWPRYRNLYVRAFDKMLKVRAEKGLKTTWKTGEEVYNWWLGL